MKTETAGSRGVLYALCAYSLWGLFPLYWKLLGGIPVWETLAHRVIWSLATVVMALTVLRRLPSFYRVLGNRAALAALGFSSFLIGINWALFILAVYSGQVVQASFGYYVNPLMNVALGVVALRERLTRLQSLAVALAALGVLILGWGYDGIPWLALGLAVSFALYGFFKKNLGVETLAGVGIEALWLTPAALAYLALLAWRGAPQAFFSASWDALLLLSTGPVTLLPLLFFNAAARRLRLTTLGFIQYLSPTLQLVIAVAIFHEPFGRLQAAAFGLIWSALALYSWEGWRKTGAYRGNPP